MRYRTRDLGIRPASDPCRPYHQVSLSYRNSTSGIIAQSGQLSHSADFDKIIVRTYAQKPDKHVKLSEATTEQTGRRRQRRSLLGVEAVAAADFYDQQRNCKGIATVNFHTTIGKILSWRVCDMRVYSWLVCPVLPLEASETGVSDSWC